MSSRATYTLLHLDERNGPHNGASFPTARRTGWEFEIHAPVVGTSVTVKLQAASGSTTDESFVDRHEVTVTQAGTTKLKNSDLDTRFTERDRWMRAIISAIDGEAVVEVLGTAPFLDPTSASDKDRLDDEVSDYSEVDRLMERAESDVLDNVLGRSRDGRIEADLTNARALPLLKEAVAIQTEWRYRKFKLSQSREPAAMQTLRGMPEVAPEVGDTVSTLQPSAGAAVWTGRG